MDLFIGKTMALTSVITHTHRPTHTHTHAHSFIHYRCIIHIDFYRVKNTHTFQKTVINRVCDNLMGGVVIE